MRPIFNYKGSIVCMGDASTGKIESYYQKSRETTFLPVGGNYTIERKGIRTVITREDETHFSVDSYDIAA